MTNALHAISMEFSFAPLETSATLQCCSAAAMTNRYFVAASNWVEIVKVRQINARKHTYTHKTIRAIHVYVCVCVCLRAFAVAQQMWMRIIGDDGCTCAEHRLPLVRRHFGAVVCAAATGRIALRRARWLISAMFVANCFISTLRA